MWEIQRQHLKNKVLTDCEIVNPTVVGGQLAQVVYAEDGSVDPEDGAIDPKAGVAVLTKETAGAYTLAAPAAADTGRTLIIISDSAAAHVVTATDLLEDGVTGGPKDTATFAAFKGAAITLLAYDERWMVLNKNVVTVAAAD